MGDEHPRQVNGELPPIESQFINHLTSYPIVSGSLTTFKNSFYGHISLQFADIGYSHFAKPIFPYFAKPYGYVEPILIKADDLGNESLNRFDNTIPTIVGATEAFKENLRGAINRPIRLVEDGKQYVLDTYTSERNAVGNGYFSGSKAAVSSSLRLTSDSLMWLRGRLVTAEASEAAKPIENGAPQKNGSA